MLHAQAVLCAGASVTLEAGPGRSSQPPRHTLHPLPPAIAATTSRTQPGPWLTLALSLAITAESACAAQPLAPAGHHPTPCPPDTAARCPGCGGCCSPGQGSTPPLRWQQRSRPVTTGSPQPRPAVSRVTCHAAVSVLPSQWPASSYASLEAPPPPAQPSSVVDGN